MTESGEHSMGITLLQSARLHGGIRVPIFGRTGMGSLLRALCNEQDAMVGDARTRTKEMCLFIGKRLLDKLFV